MPTFSVGRGITRFEVEATHSNGFMVRICRKGNRINEFFSDGAYGGKNKAKKAAVQRYQELLDEYGPANTRPTKGMRTSRNTSGVVGVHVAHSVDKRWPGCEYYAYCASWTTEDGSRKKIAFAWETYGKELALKMAKFARDKEINDRQTVLKKFKKEFEEYREKRAKQLKRQGGSAAARDGRSANSAKSAAAVGKTKPAPAKSTASRAAMPKNTTTRGSAKRPASKAALPQKSKGVRPAAQPATRVSTAKPQPKARQKAKQPAGRRK